VALSAVQIFTTYFRLPLCLALLAFVAGAAFLTVVTYHSPSEIVFTPMPKPVRTAMPTPPIFGVAGRSLLRMLPWTVGVFGFAATINWMVQFFGGRGPAESQTTDRSALFVRLSLLIYIASFFIYPMFICGCHFHFDGFLASLPAIGWGFYPYFAYRGRRERVIGYIAMALSLFALYVALESNIQFVFTR
jgi:hypothetical protein